MYNTTLAAAKAVDQIFGFKDDEILPAAYKMRLPYYSRQQRLFHLYHVMLLLFYHVYAIIKE